MSSNTPNLGLLKKDPMVDGNETFNIETMLNENWDKVDEAVGQVREELGNIDVDIPEASLTEKGIVQLSSATNGTRENVAATEKAVGQAFQAGNERKAEVVAALIAIGIQASTSETWAQLIPKIAAVNRATGNATATDILAGKTASNANGPITGSMPNRGAITLTPGKTDQAIPAGYHNGQGSVSGVPVPAANVLAGTTIAGTAGTMPNRGAGGNITPGTSNITKQAGYYSSDIIIRGEPNKIPANIKQGVSIDGVVGTLSPAMPANGAFNISNGDGRYPGTYDTLMYTIPAGANMFAMSSEGIWTWRVQNVACKIYVVLKDSNNMEIFAMGGQPGDLTYNITFTFTPMIIHYPSRTFSLSYSADQPAFSLGSSPTIPANFNLAGPVRIILRIINSGQDNLSVYLGCNKKYWQA